MADLQKMILAKRENAAGGFMNYMMDKYCKDDEGSDMENEQPNKKKGNKKRAYPGDANDQKIEPTNQKKRKV